MLYNSLCLWALFLYQGWGISSLQAKLGLPDLPTIWPSKLYSWNHVHLPHTWYHRMSGMGQVEMWIQETGLETTTTLCINWYISSWILFGSGVPASPCRKQDWTPCRSADIDTCRLHLAGKFPIQKTLFLITSNHWDIINWSLISICLQSALQRMVT